MTIQYRPEAMAEKGKGWNSLQTWNSAAYTVLLTVNLQPVAPSWVVVITIITYLYSIHYWFRLEESPVISSLASSLHAPFHSCDPRGLHFPPLLPPKAKGLCGTRSLLI